MSSILKPYIRKVTEEDRKKLPTFSYSKLEVFKNCPYQYNIKYNKKLRTMDTSLALEVGTLCHFVLETKGKMLLQNNVSYDILNEIIHNGYNNINGLDIIKDKYWEEFYLPDNKSGMTYEEKFHIFDNILKTEMEDTDWKPYLFEHDFEFVWDNRCIFHGFIDRVDKRNGQFKVVDYKTSKKSYDQSKLATSLQFGIYNLAILNEFGVLPVENEYRFILIDERQYALTKGWEKRLVKALTKILDGIDKNQSINVWSPSPTPLCYWCSYCTQNPNASIYKDECMYYSLWTPTNKTFKKNAEFNALKEVKTERKLIF